MGESLGVFDWLCSFLQTKEALQLAATSVCDTLVN